MADLIRPQAPMRPPTAPVIRGTLAAWRASTLEHVLILGAFFLTLVWPAYLVFPLGPLNVTPARLVTASSIPLFCAFTFLFSRRSRVFFRIVGRNKLMFALYVLFLGWRLISDFNGINPSNAFIQTVLEAVANSCFLLILTAVALKSPRSIVEAIFWATVVIFSAGLLELLFGFSISARLILYSSVDSEQFAAYASDVVRGVSLRIKSLSSHPILFGSYVAASLPVLLYTRRRGRLPSIRIVSLVLLVLSPVLLMASGARSALLGAVVGLSASYGLSVLRASRRNPAVLIFVFFVATMSVTALAVTPAGSKGIDTLYSLINGRDKSEQSSTQSRLAMVDNGLDALHSRPIMGYGDGEAARVAGLKGRENLLTIDSYYLVSAVNFGFVGLVLNVLLLFSIVVAGFKGSIDNSINADQSLLAALTGSSLCVLTCAVTVTSAEYFPIVYALGAVSAVALARPRLFVSNQSRFFGVDPTAMRAFSAAA